MNNPNLIKRFFRFICEGWIWILMPILIVAVALLLIIIFSNPYDAGALDGKLIFLYSLFGG